MDVERTQELIQELIRYAPFSIFAGSLSVFLNPNVAIVWRAAAFGIGTLSALYYRNVYNNEQRFNQENPNRQEAEDDTYGLKSTSYMLFGAGFVGGLTWVLPKLTGPVVVATGMACRVLHEKLIDNPPQGSLRH